MSVGKPISDCSSYLLFVVFLSAVIFTGATEANPNMVLVFLSY